VLHIAEYTGVAAIDTPILKEVKDGLVLPKHLSCTMRQNEYTSR
jgi:hypothetical protein